MGQQAADPNAFMIGALIGSLVVGLLCGLIVWKFAQSRGRNSVGIVALIACIVAGLFAGLIGAVPVALCFAGVVAVLPAPSKKKSKSSRNNFAPRTPTQNPYDL